jgi:hypothetical protein
MWRIALGWFVVAHGLLTILIWAPNPRTVDANAPMDTSHSWLFGDAHARFRWSWRWSPVSSSLLRASGS